eukprot:SAG31_NODE_419_length_15872_cov_21.857985_9_plen_124_part_00
MVKLPKGTIVQITTAGRHRNPDLWGETANQFNPDRKWEDDELWHDQVHLIAAFTETMWFYTGQALFNIGCGGWNIGLCSTEPALASILTFHAHSTRLYWQELRADGDAYYTDPIVQEFHFRAY